MAKETRSKGKGRKADSANAKAKDASEELKEVNTLVENKQVFYVVLVMALVIISFFVGYVIFQQSKIVYYEGFRFEKIMYEKLPLYYIKIPIVQLTGQLVNYNLYLRNDPRKLGIAEGTDVDFLKKEVFISLNSDFEKCEDTTLAMTNLGMLFGAMGLEAKGSLDNKEEADAASRPYITCENTKNNTVVSYRVAGSGETRIEQDENCYIISVANCEIQKATEAFIVKTLSDLKDSQE